MNVKDLILESVPETETTDITTTTRKPRKAPQGPTWEVVLSDACDGAVRRKTVKTSRLLVLLLSQKQYYIKDEVTDEVEKLDAKSLAAFLKGIDHGLKVVPWSTPLETGLANAERFVRVIENDDFVWLAKRGLHVYTYGSYVYDDNAGHLSTKRKQNDSPVNRAILKVLEEVLGKERLAAVIDGAARNEQEEKARNLLKDGVQYLSGFNDKFGLDWTREYLRDFLTSPFVGANLVPDYYMSDLLGVCNYEPKRFVEYMLHDSVRMGYGVVPGSRAYNYDLRNFVNEWYDTLRIERAIHNGKVVDKYPAALAEVHRKLSFKMTLLQQRIDVYGFQEHSERLSKHAYSDEQYLIRPPYNKEDMIDEATQQSNCLASYVRAYSENATDIYIMRSKDDPEKSLVTVEVRGGKVRQAYRACNQQPSNDELEWLRSWCASNSIEWFDADHQRPLCA